MSFGIEEGSDGRSFRLTGELDLATGDELMKRLAPAVHSEGDIRLDVAGLQFIDSSGIRALIIMCKELGDRGRVVLWSPRGEVAQVLELVGADGFPNLLIQTDGGSETLASQVQGPGS